MQVRDLIANLQQFDQSFEVGIKKETPMLEINCPECEARVGKTPFYGTVIGASLKNDRCEVVIDFL